MLDPTFVSNLQQIKQALYQTTVFGPSLNSENAQDNAILNEFLQGLNQLYEMSLRAQEGKPLVEERLRGFPATLQPSIQELLEWIRVYFQKNTPRTRIPYTHYLSRTLRIYPFVHQPIENGSSAQNTDQEEDAMNYL